MNREEMRKYAEIKEANEINAKLTGMIDEYLRSGDHHRANRTRDLLLNSIDEIIGMM